ncbi:MAG: zeta toxin family protein [Synergistaceae bacterium]|nr:zeta toxin family protein [Synergistaceae bacterium]
MREDDKPLLVVIAGPNGSGKSTITRELEKDFDFPTLYINADEIKKDEGISDAEAWEKAEQQRAEALNNRESFAFETVFSHPSKADLMKQAKKAGYKVDLYFICTQDPDVNVLRVKERYKTGGHDVPEDKIRNRYVRSMNILKQSLTFADKAAIFNNSWEKPELIAQKTADGKIRVYPLHDRDSRSIWTKEAIETLLGIEKLPPK